MQFRFYLKNNKSASNMNSNSPDVATDLLGHRQSYDDSFLRKRVTCIGSGLLLCFIIGGAGLGISIIILLKFEGTAGVFPQYAANQTEHMKALKDQIKQLQKQVETLNNEVSSFRKPGYPSTGDAAPLDIDSSGPDSFGMNHDSSHVTLVSKDNNVSEIINNDAGHEHHSVDLESSTTNPEELHHHHHNGHEQNANDKEGPPIEHEQDTTPTSHDHNSQHQPSSLDHHSHHQPSSHDHHNSMGRSEVETPSINELLCDDSDLCLPSVEEGSGLFDGSGDYFNDDGSMEVSDFSEGIGDCIQYARPVCPENFKVCYTEDPCPIPVCCYSN